MDKKQICQKWKSLKKQDHLLWKISGIFLILGTIFLVAWLVGDLFTKKILFKADTTGIRVQIMFFGLFALALAIPQILFYPLLWGKKVDNFINFFYWKDWNEASFQEQQFKTYLAWLEKGQKLLKIKLFCLIIDLLLFGLILFLYFFLF